MIKCPLIEQRGEERRGGIDGAREDIKADEVKRKGKRERGREGENKTGTLTLRVLFISTLKANTLTFFLCLLKM